MTAVVPGTIYYFVPPTELSVDPVPGPQPFPGGAAMRRLMSFYKPRPRGTSVWLLQSGALVQTRDCEREPDNVVKVYSGGHIHKVQNSEAQRLLDAGFQLSTTPPE